MLPERKCGLNPPTSVLINTWKRVVDAIAHMTPQKAVFRSYSDLCPGDEYTEKENVIKQTLTELVFEQLQRRVWVLILRVRRPTILECWNGNSVSLHGLGQYVYSHGVPTRVSKRLSNGLAK